MNASTYTDTVVADQVRQYLAVRLGRVPTHVELMLGLASARGGASSNDPVQVAHRMDDAFGWVHWELQDAEEPQDDEDEIV